jgi:putative DNA primase/helicase
MPTERKQDLAETFCQDAKHVTDLVYVRGIDAFALYKKDCGYFKLFTEFEFEKYVYLYTKSRATKDISSSIIKDIIGQIKFLVFSVIEYESTHHVAFQDKTLNIQTFEWERHSPAHHAFRFINCLSTDVDNLYPGDRFFSFLQEVLVEKDKKTSDELLLVVQEMFGYCLLGTNKAHVAFFLLGNGRNGKSVMLDVLREMIGVDYVSSVNIETLTTNQFAAADLIGKRINICNEDESKYIRADRFKALVAGDPLYVRRLYQQGFSMKLIMTFIFATNDPPTFADLNDGLTERLLIIPFHRRFLDTDQDKDLLPKLLKEMPHIVGWAIEGAKRLIANKFVFTKCALLQESKRQFERGISSAIMFLDEKYTEDETVKISNDDIYTNYTIWCEAKRKKALSYHNFMKDLNNKLTIPSSTLWDSSKGRSIRGRCLRERVEEVL